MKPLPRLLLVSLGLLTIATLVLVTLSQQGQPLEDSAASPDSLTPAAEASTATAASPDRPETPLYSTASDSTEHSSPAKPPSPADPTPITDADPIEQSAENALAALPPGPLRDGIEQLPPAARQRALAKLATLNIPAEDYASLRVTGDGGLYYSHDIPPPPNDALPGMASLPIYGWEERPGRTASAQTSAAAVPIATPPERESLPGSTNVLYLDFNGHTITGTSWNSGQGRPETYVGLPYDIDGDPTTFSDDEQAAIIEIWERVAEDYAPFDVNVTTVEPAVFTSTTGRALITRATDGNGVDMPSSGAGGVAQLAVFGESDYATRSSPAFVYYDNLSNSTSNIAEATSHELGHNMGLTHDGQPGDEYYNGHGTGETSWGTIMGVSYGKNVTQWSKGEYFNANNTQDDIAIMAGLMAYRSDEAGDTIGTSAAADVNGDEVSASGVISNSADADVFSVNTAAGTISFNVAGYRAGSGSDGGNTDFVLELLDAGGSVLATHDPSDSKDATLTYAADAGSYFVRVSGTGIGTPLADRPTGYTSYGSAGQYTLSGTILAAAPAITSETAVSIPAGAVFSYSIIGTNSPASYGASNLPAGLSVNSDTGVINGQATETGEFTVTLSATNSLGTGNATLTLTVTDAVPAIVSQTTGRILVLPGADQTLSVSVISANGSPTYQWRHNGRDISGANSADLVLSSATFANSGYYQVDITNSIGTTTSETVFVQVAPTVTQLLLWGSNANGETAAPDGLTDAIKVSLGYEFALALKRDGTIVGWGSNSSGQSTIPAGLSDVVDIATGNFHAAALKADGTVVAWGNDFYDQATVPSGLTNVVAVDAGGSFTLALKSDGTVVAWGFNENDEATVPGGLTDVVGIAAGDSHALALKADGTVVAWGSNGEGETTVSASATNTVLVAAGGEYSFALQEDGSLVSWGDTSFGARTLPDGVTTFSTLAAGRYHGIGLTASGSVEAWGFNSNNQTDVPVGIGQAFAVDASQRNSAVIRNGSADTAPIISEQPATATVVEETEVTLSVTASGGTSYLYYQWRKGGVDIAGANAAALTFSAISLADAGDYDVVITNQLGSVTSATATLTVNPVPVISSLSDNRQTFSAGQTITLNVQATGTGDLTYQWYRDGVALAGATAATFSQTTANLTHAGVYHVIITDDIGSRRSAPIFVLYAPTGSEVIGWGLNDNGQTTAPEGLNDAIDVAAGDTHALALKADGTVVAWGSNISGETDVPDGLNNVVRIAAGDQVSLALQSDGTVVRWGRSNFGLGTLPSGLSQVVAIAVENIHAIALNADGTVHAWGNNGSGQTDVPGDLSPARGVAVTGNTSFALHADGSVTAWGFNGNDELELPDGLNAVRISGGYYHALALLPNGTVDGWGFAPLSNQPGGLAGVIDITAGVQLSVALKSDQTVAVWGSTNSNGEIDPPDGLEDIFAISGGGNFALVIKEVPVPMAPAFSLHPADQTVTAGGSVTFTANATGFPAPTYQWRKDSQNISGATAASYTIAAVTTDDTGFYDVVATNDSGSATSNQATLTVNTPPAITAQPQSTTVEVGANVSLSVTAIGSPTPTYQWRKDGEDIDGATGSTLDLGTVGLDDTGDYDVVITNSIDSVTSDVATVTVRQAPAISEQPESQIAVAGNTVTFNVTASGTPTPTYQWRKDGENIDGATDASLQLTGVSPSESGDYDVVVTNAAGSETSDTATLTVRFVPQISVQPENQTVTAGDDVAFSVTATGVPTPTYQWRKDGVDIDGATGATLNLTDVDLSDAAGYNVVVTNIVGSSASATATLTVNTPPSILEHPGNQTVEEGESVTFSVTAAGVPNPTYQWRKDGENIDGATGASHTIASTSTEDAGDYDVVITNIIDTVTSTAATLTVQFAPDISAQPQSQTVTVGDDVTLNVTATGLPTPTFQWRKDGENIDGATGASLSLTDVELADAADYDVLITNEVGSTTSATATLTVQVAPSISEQPAAQTTVLTGADVTLSVTASGTPAPTYQWRKDGEGIDSATGTSLALEDVTMEDAATYTVVVTNAAGSVTSTDAIVSVVQISGSHTTDGYTAGETITITNTVTYAGPITSLTWSVMPPAAIELSPWSFVSTAGDVGGVVPAVDQVDLLDWSWSTLPTSPFTFSYVLNVPAAAEGSYELDALITLQSNGTELEAMVTPDPLTLAEPVTRHTADTDGDYRINLSELLRVIELYNTRFGTSRTGRYQEDSQTQDGFAADASFAADEPTTLTRFHAADTDQDGLISLSELLRLIELYNYREGTTRTGEYHVDPNGADGFATGPAPDGA